MLSNFADSQVQVVEMGGGEVPDDPYYPDYPEESNTLKYVLIGAWGLATVTTLWYLLKSRG